MKELPDKWWVNVTVDNLEILKEWSKKANLNENHIVGMCHTFYDNSYQIEYNPENLTVDNSMISVMK